LTFFSERMLIKLNSGKSLGIPPPIQYNFFFQAIFYTFLTTTNSNQFNFWAQVVNFLVSSKAVFNLKLIIKNYIIYSLDRRIL